MGTRLLLLAALLTAHVAARPGTVVGPTETTPEQTQGSSPVLGAAVRRGQVLPDVEPLEDWNVGSGSSTMPAFPSRFPRMAGLPDAGFSRPSIFATGSACGYGNIFEDGFGTLRVSASEALFNSGSMCGACFQVKCHAMRSPKICRKNASVVLTVTDRCRANSLMGPGDPCGTAAAKHLSLPRDVYALLSLNWNKGGGKVLPQMPILFRRVACPRRGGLEFALNGSPKLLQVNVRNVGGAGTVNWLWVLPKGTNIWLPMQRIWGQNWIAPGAFVGKGLSFKAMTVLTNSTVVVANVVPPGWEIGEVYRGKGQFV